MDKPILFRKRIIPQECIQLKDDEILFYDENLIVTKWEALRKKKDLDHGYSCYFLKQGFKVSKFLYENGNLLYWYCDIINFEKKENQNEYVFKDLLADVIVYPDGFVKVVDLGEFEEALESETITLEEVKAALKSMDHLLKIIYSGGFDDLKQEIEKRE